MKNKQYQDRKKGRKRYYTFSTRLKYSERNELLSNCKKVSITPSEFIRQLILIKFQEEMIKRAELESEDDK
jgi:hypothetical protein